MYNEYEAPIAVPTPVGTYKGVHLALVLVPNIVGIVFLIAGFTFYYLVNGESFTREPVDLFSVFPAIIIISLGSLSLLAGIVFYLIAIYRAWALLQDSQFPRTTPGKAVGFLFIPFYQLYWIFQAFYGYAIDFNAYTIAKRYEIDQLNSSLYMAGCVLLLCGFIPFIGFIARLAGLVIGLICTIQMIDRMNKLAALKNSEALAALSA